MPNHDETLAVTRLELLTNHQMQMNEPIVFETVNKNLLALADIKEGLQKWRIWVMLAYQDIRLRYRRSVLGPFWLTLSMAITVYSMGFLYARLFHMQLDQYFPFLVAGMLAWSLISTIVIEFTEGFMGSDSLLKQTKLPYTLYMHRITCKNIFIFFHNIFVIVPIMIIYHETTKVNFNTLFLLPGLMIIYVNAIAFGTILSMIGARYRDVSQIIKSLVQVIFFVTPVMWGPEILNSTNHWIIDLNPFYAYLELIRAPLLGSLPTIKNMVMVATMTTLGLALSWRMFSQYRARIIYWI